MYSFGGNGEIKSLGENNSKEIRGMKMEIGLAVSQDGLHWSRVEGPSPHGAVLEIGKEGEFDNIFVINPTVIELEREYRMYYNTYDMSIQKFVIGCAVAKDGLLTWEKVGPIFAGAEDGDDENCFDYKGASRRHILRLDDGSYRMYYEGVSKAGIHSIGLAKSNDGLKWTKASTEPILSRRSDSEGWDNGGVGSPHVVWLPNERRWRLYYMGYGLSSDGSLGDHSKPGLGVAESEDEDGLIFKRLRLY
jgi:predicted GH43/DUF377 family glycosyl hydrolase